MRTVLHLGLFVLALTFVGQASADHDYKRNRKRHTSVVTTADVADEKVRPVRSPAEPLPPRYDWRYERQHHRPDPGLIEARRELYKQRKEHEQIVRIVERWERATAHGNPHPQYNVERRLMIWIDREIEESHRKHGQGRYVQRLHSLRRELKYATGWYAYGRSKHRFDSRKAAILDELVELAEQQLLRAENRVRRHMHLAFAYR